MAPRAPALLAVVFLIRVATSDDAPVRRRAGDAGDAQKRQPADAPDGGDRAKERLSPAVPEAQPEVATPTSAAPVGELPGVAEGTRAEVMEGGARPPHLAAAASRSNVQDARDVSSNMFAYHKALWPLSAVDWLTFVSAALALMIAAGGGIGGGGILVPLYMILLGFRPKHAIALSNFTILGGSIANTLFNVQKSNGGDNIINWDIIVMMEPSTIAGAVIGSFASKFLPDFVLTVSLAIALSLLSVRAIQKGLAMLHKENAEEAERALVNGGPAPPEYEEAEGLISGRVKWIATEKGDGGAHLANAAIGCCGASPIDRGNVADPAIADVPWDKVLLLALCFVGCVLLTVLKGSGHGSVIGVECGSPPFWALSLGCIPWVTLFGAAFRHMLLREHEAKAKDARSESSSDIAWDSRTTITYPLICTIAGVFAGLFGVGGGIVKGPLMLEMGVRPVVAAATAATMILFTTSAACVSFGIFGLLEPHYGATCCVLGLVCTAIGQSAVNTWMRSAKRQSPPVLSIGAVMVMSAVLVLIEGIEKFRQHDLGELFTPSAICSRSD